MKKKYEYKAISRLDMRDPKLKLLYKLNAVAFISILVSCVTGLILNYCLRMMGESGGFYIIYIVCGFVLCLIYPYVHECAHAVAIIAVKGKAPYIRFGKLAAYCGSPDIIFTKYQYYFAVSFPFLFYCALLIPLCILLDPVYFPLPFMPLMYNIFGSIADAFMFRKVFVTPRRTIVVDGGTEVVMYAPVTEKQHF